MESSERRLGYAFAAPQKPLAQPLALARSRDPPGDAVRLLGAADSLMIARLAAGEGFELGPQSGRLASALVSA